MDSILTFMNEASTMTKSLLWTTLTILVLSFAIYKMWEKVSFWWLRVLCHIPVFGKITRLSKNHAYDPDKGWFSSEREICAEFHPYFEKSDVKPDFFDDCSSYLRKVQETGRKNLSMIGWIMLSVMVFIEAMGFSYVLAGWTIPGASESLKEQGAYGIAILISGLLVFLTHHTGHEQHHNSLIKKIRTWYTQSGEQNHKMIPNTKVSLDNELVDGDEPEWKQLLNRLSANDKVTPTNKTTLMTVVFIVIIAIGSTYVRGQTLESTTAEAALNPADNSMYGTTEFSNADPYALSPTTVPDELLGAQQEADHDAIEAKKTADSKGAWTTFIMLAVIFVFLQLMGIIIGYKTGFAGKESSNARSFIGRFRTRDEFSAYHERKRNQIAQQAQKILEKLQSRLVENAQNTNIDGVAINNLKNTNGRNFYAYVANIRNERIKHEEQPTVSAKQPAQEANTQIAGAPPVILLAEDEIDEWMGKLGWDRERTIALLKKHKAEEKQKAVLSEEEAMKMLVSKSTLTMSDDEAAQMLAEATGENKA